MGNNKKGKGKGKGSAAASLARGFSTTSVPSSKNLKPKEDSETDVTLAQSQSQSQSQTQTQTQTQAQSQTQNNLTTFSETDEIMEGKDSQQPLFSLTTLPETQKDHTCNMAQIDFASLESKAETESRLLRQKAEKLKSDPSIPHLKLDSEAENAVGEFLVCLDSAGKIDWRLGAEKAVPSDLGVVSSLTVISSRLYYTLFTLEKLGFTNEQAQNAMRITGGMCVESCLNWVSGSTLHVLRCILNLLALFNYPAMFAYAV
jgi:hypothetical protein